MDQFENVYQPDGVGEYYWNYVDFPVNWCAEPSSCFDNGTSHAKETSQDPSTPVDLNNVIHEDLPNRQSIANKTKYEIKQQKRKEKYHQLPPRDRYLFNYRNRYQVDPRRTKLTEEEEGKIKRVKTRNAMDTWQRRQKEKFGEQEDSGQSGNENEKEMESMKLSRGTLGNDHLALESDGPKTLNDLLILKNAKNPNGADPYFWRKLKHPPLTRKERQLKHNEQRRKKYRASKTEIYAPREARLQESETARGAVMKVEDRCKQRVNEQDSNPALHEQATRGSHGNIGYVYTQLHMNEPFYDVTPPTWYDVYEPADYVDANRYDDAYGTVDCVDANQNLYPYQQLYDIEPIETQILEYDVEPSPPLLFEDPISSAPFGKAQSDEQKEQRRIKRNAQARERYQRLSKAQRQDYMKRGNMYTYGVDPSNPNLTQEDHLHIVKTKEMQLEERRQRYHELPEEEKKEKIRRGNEQRGKRRLKEYLIMSTPVENVTEEVLEQTLDISERKNREVEKYSEWYQRQSEEKKQEIRERDREAKKLKRQSQSMMKTMGQQSFDELVSAPEFQDFSYPVPQDHLQNEPPTANLEYMSSSTTPNQLAIDKLKHEQIKFLRRQRIRENERARYHALTEEQRKEKNRKNCECRRRNADRRKGGRAYRGTSSTSEGWSSEPTHEQLMEEQRKIAIRKARKNELKRAHYQSLTKEERREHNKKKNAYKKIKLEKKKLENQMKCMDIDVDDPGPLDDVEHIF
ncbi:hypothetical protein CAEBREN_22723 [Caenorhabditis brenneri]|uniref:Uncharacterized protein n=1 Tax=Caenorhabditis brenneri TaxID=135651 RepID=G0NBW4_CAEBE|nr:hypothetical protein CAEBREN_22723 [Caenorhabditis brenneri]